jgi:hypothetical protein
VGPRAGLYYQKANSSSIPGLFTTLQNLSRDHAIVVCGEPDIVSNSLCYATLFEVFCNRASILCSNH